MGWRDKERGDRERERYNRSRDCRKINYSRVERHDHYRRENRSGFFGNHDRRDRYGDYRIRARSRSRSPIRHYRGRSLSPRRERDDYRGGGRDVGFNGYHSGRHRSRERGDYRSLERGWSSEKEYHNRDFRGYK